MRRMFVIAIVLIAQLWSGAFASDYEINTYTVTSSALSGGLRIALLADMHDAAFAEELAEELRSLAPDLILLAGDMVNADDEDMSSYYDYCTELAAIGPIYAIPGNHEEVIAWKNKEFVKRIRATGIHYLMNEEETITLNGETLSIVGMSDTSASAWKKNGKKTMERLSDSYDGVRLCLAHVPQLYREGLEYFEYDLAVAGHVQGGVIQIPGIGGLYSREEGFFPEFSGGEYELANGARLIVSRGLGASEASFLRINNKPELVLIEMVPGEGAGHRYCEIVNASSSVNVRGEPSLQAKVIASAKPGERHVLLSGEEDGWYCVRVHGAEGYIFGDYVQPIDD